MEPFDEITLEKGGEKKVMVGTLQNKEDKEQLVGFLSNNQHIFAWMHQDMSMIDPSIICHKLNMNLDFPPYQQKQRMPTSERNKIFSDI